MTLHFDPYPHPSILIPSHITSPSLIPLSLAHLPHAPFALSCYLNPISINAYSEKDVLILLSDLAANLSTYGSTGSLVSADNLNLGEAAQTQVRTHVYSALQYKHLLYLSSFEQKMHTAKCSFHDIFFYYPHNAHNSTHTHTHKHKHAHTHTNTNSHTHTHTHTRSHTLTHTHTGSV
jgi:hypothetical protein